MQNASIPSIVTKATDFKNLGSTFCTNNNEELKKLGGFILDGECVWLCNGSILKAINVESGTVVSTYDFTYITKQANTKIVCTIECSLPDTGSRYSNQDESCLVVACNTNNNKAYISFYHAKTSRILYSIELKGQISSLCLITAKRSHSNPLHSILKMMSGVLAVGMEEGIVCIVDIKSYALVIEYYNPSGMKSAPNRVGDLIFVDVENDGREEIKSKLSLTKTSKSHLAFVLNALATFKIIVDGIVMFNLADALIDEFRILIGSEDFYRNAMNISAMLFVPKTSILAVGYNMGAFQLWDMSQLTCLYTSPSVRNETPITRFSLQEPCNDPQLCCYLWVMHESNRPDFVCLPFAIMYSILFKRKSESYTSSAGDNYLKGFVNCRIRFTMDLDPEEGFDGRCVTSHVVSNTTSYLTGGSYDNEDKNTATINLFVMIFETWEHAANSNYVSMLVFDMNQWYKEQMPPQYYPGFSQTFMSSIPLDKITGKKYTLFDVFIHKKSIQQFLSFNSSEQFSHPSSLAFNTLFLVENKVVHLRLPGIQRHVLESIEMKGPSALINPNAMYMMCRSAGLVPCFYSSNANPASWSQVELRNFVLTVLLEHRMSKFLTQCVSEWADGRYALSKCNLNTLISWCWNCVTEIKNVCDAICIPLFDYTGTELDRETYYKLKHCCQLIHIITDLFTHINNRYRHFLLDGVYRMEHFAQNLRIIIDLNFLFEKFKFRHIDGADLNGKLNTLILIKEYFDVIIWCIDNALLPEKLDSTSETSVPAFISSLIQGSNQRRTELKTATTWEAIPDSSGVYLIDELVKNASPVNGARINEQWERESGGLSDGSYPPICLQSLLRIYLMSDISLAIKHSILLYFLFDVCNYHKDEEITKKLLSFPLIVGRSMIKTSVIQLYWFIDNKSFEDVSRLLSIGIIKKMDINPTFHRKIIHIMMMEDQFQLALKYMHFIRPLTIDFYDDEIYIMVLLYNGLMIEAFNVQKNNRTHQDHLLQAFFKYCEHLGMLKKILKLSLNDKEEYAFISYLDKCSDKNTAEDLKVMYFLSRGRYVEAIDINNQLNGKHSSCTAVGYNKTSKHGRSSTRDLLVHAFSKTLPNVTHDLINHCMLHENSISKNNNNNVFKPGPLSVIVHSDIKGGVPVFRSTKEHLLQCMIKKTEETWSNLPKIPFQEKKYISKLAQKPFLRSDITFPKNYDFDQSSAVSQAEVKPKKRTAEALEPPSKRFKKLNNGQPSDYANEKISTPTTEAENDTTLPFKIDDTILHTPVVQKRNAHSFVAPVECITPKSSILKRTALPRFKSPHKVDFDIPDVHTTCTGSHPLKIRRAPTPKPLLHSFEEQIEKESKALKLLTPEKLVKQVEESVSRTKHPISSICFDESTLDESSSEGSKIADVCSPDLVQNPESILTSCENEMEWEVAKSPIASEFISSTVPLPIIDVSSDHNNTTLPTTQSVFNIDYSNFIDAKIPENLELAKTSDYGYTGPEAGPSSKNKNETTSNEMSFSSIPNIQNVCSLLEMKNVDKELMCSEPVVYPEHNVYDEKTEAYLTDEEKGDENNYSYSVSDDDVVLLSSDSEVDGAEVKNNDNNFGDVGVEIPGYIGEIHLRSNLELIESNQVEEFQMEMEQVLVEDYQNISDTEIDERSGQKNSAVIQDEGLENEFIGSVEREGRWIQDEVVEDESVETDAESRSVEDEGVEDESINSTESESVESESVHSESSDGGSSNRIEEYIVDEGSEVEDVRITDDENSVNEEEIEREEDQFSDSQRSGKYDDVEEQIAYEVDDGSSNEEEEKEGPISANSIVDDVINLTDSSCDSVDEPVVTPSLVGATVDQTFVFDDRIPGEYVEQNVCIDEDERAIENNNPDSSHSQTSPVKHLDIHNFAEVGNLIENEDLKNILKTVERISSLKVPESSESQNQLPDADTTVMSPNQSIYEKSFFEYPSHKQQDDSDASALNEPPNFDVNSPSSPIIPKYFFGADDSDIIQVPECSVLNFSSNIWHPNSERREDDVDQSISGYDSVIRNIDETIDNSTNRRLGTIDESSWSLKISSCEHSDDVVDDTEDEQSGYRSRKRKRSLKESCMFSETSTQPESDSQIILEDNRMQQQPSIKKQKSNQSISETSINPSVDVTQLDDEQPMSSRAADESDWCLNISNSETSKITTVSTDDEEESFNLGKRTSNKKRSLSKFGDTRTDNRSRTKEVQKSSLIPTSNDMEIAESDFQKAESLDDESSTLESRRKIKLSSRYSSRSSLADIVEEPTADDQQSTNEIKSRYDLRSRESPLKYSTTSDLPKKQSKSVSDFPTSSQELTPTSKRTRKRSRASSVFGLGEIPELPEDNSSVSELNISRAPYELLSPNVTPRRSARISSMASNSGSKRTGASPSSSVYEHDGNESVVSVTGGYTPKSLKRRNVAKSNESSENDSRSITSLRRSSRRLSIPTDSESVDEKKSKTRKRTSGSQDPPVASRMTRLKSLPTTSTPLSKTKAKSSKDSLNEYAIHRRLTRNQLNMMEGKVGTHSASSSIQKKTPAKDELEEDSHGEPPRSKRNQKKK